MSYWFEQRDTLVLARARMDFAIRGSVIDYAQNRKPLSLIATAAKTRRGHLVLIDVDDAARSSAYAFGRKN